MTIRSTTISQFNGMVEVCDDSGFVFDWLTCPTLADNGARDGPASTSVLMGSAGTGFVVPAEGVLGEAGGGGEEAFAVDESDSAL